MSNILPASEMSSEDIKKLLTSYYDYDEFMVEFMDDDELEYAAQEVINDFEGSETEQDIRQSCLIDLDDENEPQTLLEVLETWEDICDDSDMYPNGKDDD